MAKNWIPYGEVKDGKPTECTVAAACHKNRDQALLVEKRQKPHKDIFSIIIVSKENHESLIGAIDRFEEKEVAKTEAQRWMNRNEEGV